MFVPHIVSVVIVVAGSFVTSIAVMIIAVLIVYCNCCFLSVSVVGIVVDLHCHWNCAAIVGYIVIAIANMILIAVVVFTVSVTDTVVVVVVVVFDDDDDGAVAVATIVFAIYAGFPMLLPFLRMHVLTLSSTLWLFFSLLLLLMLVLLSQ